MADYIDLLAQDAVKSIKEGRYETCTKVAATPKSLKKAIINARRIPIISEVKFASPSEGTLRKNGDLKKIVRSMEKGGAAGISILTEPKHFSGHIKFVAEARIQVDVPILMKDIILSPVQIEAASRSGANAILLIQALFDRGYCELDVQSMIEQAHSKNLEALLEVHTENEFLTAVKTSADLIGINNRDLKTLQVNLEVTKRILTKHSPEGKVIVSESGINTPQDILYLNECGAQAFLIGTAIMKAGNIREKVKQLVEST
ncbi:MAG: indole-3-glycerol-phosphate synthase [Candidatus Jordarchaeum sp.]|uniref:indole-3-glycerol-phosphate synthase n=1 Tax=Candidatus Jordarchaeum sp. TaxID=2823881 RepID=UPI00404B81CE